MVKKSGYIQQIETPWTASTKIDEHDGSHVLALDKQIKLGNLSAHKTVKSYEIAFYLDKGHADYMRQVAKQGFNSTFKKNEYYLGKLGLCQHQDRV